MKFLSNIFGGKKEGCRSDGHRDAAAGLWMVDAAAALDV